jgi:hypothetical protein
VSRLGGRLVTEEELRNPFARAAEQRGRPYIDTIAVADGMHLVLPTGNLNGKGNHGCDPNLWWVGPYALATRRDIAAGEELTNDYATSTAAAEFAMACRCGSALCRRTVTGDDWRLPELQRRYGDHWTPALLTLIRSSA